MPSGHVSAANDGHTSRLRALFDAALEQPDDHRADWIAAHVGDADQRARLLRLLAATDAPSLLDIPAAERVARIGAEEEVEEEEPAAPEQLLGQHIGTFRLTRLLGQGGMATVFLGERSGGDFSQQAAVKLLRRGLYSEVEQRLFRRERQALAMLSHPNIARLIDGGVTAAGIPYLVMEYVDGMPLTEHADQRGLDLRARLRLFLVVCRAVDAAHRQLIVHRDLKPSNILVTADGTVKLLDFGIAKLLEEDGHATQTVMAALTPDYAAPEQFAGSVISTATDVYALGVLLHELLLGVRPPRHAGWRPSSRQPTLRGDLDNILMKALAEEPALRYASAGALADDIGRHLDGRPVVAHPPSRWYRARKFARRHRGGVALTAVIALSLIGGLTLALWQGGIARREAARANAMRDFMFTAFAEAEPSSPRAGPPSITEVVETAIAAARDDRTMNASARVELLTRLGEVLGRQGRLEAAQAELQANYERSLGHFGPRHALTLDAGHALMANQVLLGQLDGARELGDALLARTPRDDSARRAQLLETSATLATKQHDLERARREGSEALALSRAGGDPDLVLESLQSFGNVQLTINDPAGAAATYEEALRLMRQRHGSRHVRVAAIQAALSRAYRRTGELDRAEAAARAALAIDAAVLPPDDWRRAQHLNALMMVQMTRRDYAAALASCREALRIKRKALGDDAGETLADIHNLGALHLKLGDYAAAVPPLREALQHSEKQYGPRHYESAFTRESYGYALAMAGSVADGEAQMRIALADLEALPERDFNREAIGWEHLVQLKLAAGPPAEAVPLIDRLAAAIARIEPSDPYWDGHVDAWRGQVLLRQGRQARARTTLIAAAAGLGKTLPQNAELQIETLLHAARAAQAGHDAAASRRLIEQAAAAMDRLPQPPARLRRLAEQLDG